MRVFSTSLPDVKIIEPAIHSDERGYFFESWNAAKFAEAGITSNFVQDNQSHSMRGVLRGLHYQIGRPQGKLCRVPAGKAYDVVVDIRRSSATFRKWVGIELSAENKRMLWVPPGFAHGFLVLEDGTDFLYKCTDFYDPREARGIRWDDPDLGIDWPLSQVGTPLLSKADREVASFKAAELFD